MLKADHQPDVQLSDVVSERADSSDIDGGSARLSLSEEFSKLMIEDALDRYDLTRCEAEHSTVEVNNNCSNLLSSARQKLFNGDDLHQNGVSDVSPSESDSVTLTQGSSDLSTVQSCLSSVTLTQESDYTFQQKAQVPDINARQLFANDTAKKVNGLTDPVLEKSYRDIGGMCAHEPSNALPETAQEIESCGTLELSAVSLVKPEVETMLKVEKFDHDACITNGEAKSDDSNNHHLSLQAPSATLMTDAYNRTDFVHSIIDKQPWKSRPSGVVGAITADSRQYNVFTFFENDGSISDDNDDEEQEESDNLSDIKGHSNRASVSSVNSRLGTMNEVTSPSAMVDAHEHARAVNQTHLSPKVIEDDNMPDLDLPAIMPVSYEAESGVSSKRKIVPSSPFDGDVSLSPASSLPDLYKLDGRNSPYDLDDIDLHNNSDFDEAVASSVYGSVLDWEDTVDEPPIEPIPECSACEEYEDRKKWCVVQIGDKSYRIDMKSIDPYKKVLSHGGHYGNGVNAILVFTACHLPEKTCPDYHHIMDNLFLYVMSTLELLVVEEYMIVYFHSPASRRRIPGIRWFKRCYDMIDRRLRKNLQGLLVVHPTLFLKTIMTMMKPFVSSKFSAKVRFVSSLADLTSIIPTEYMFIPDEVLHDDRIMNPTTKIPCHKFVNY